MGWKQISIAKSNKHTWAGNLYRNLFTETTCLSVRFRSGKPLGSFVQQPIKSPYFLSINDEIEMYF